MRSPVLTAPPLPSTTSAETFLRSLVKQPSALRPVSVAPFVTTAGWHGSVRELAYDPGSSPQRLIAVDFAVMRERCVLYRWLAVSDSTPAAGAIPLSVPVFRNNQTLSQLTALPLPSEPLPDTGSARRNLFAKMRRNWSATGVVFDLVDSPSLGSVNVDFAHSPRPSMTELLGSMTRSLSAGGEQASTIKAYQGATLGAEYFAIGYVSGQTHERATGVIYGDRHCILVDGSYSLGDSADHFREFIARLTHELPLRGSPPNRVRQVRHTIPPGWAVRTRDLTTHLIAPDSAGIMTVLPAEPREQGWTDLKKLVYEDVITHVEITSAMTSTLRETKKGLRAEIFTVKGRSDDRAEPFALTTGILVDDRFRYVVRYEDHTRAYQQEFEDVLDSIEPIPVAAKDAPVALSTLRNVFPVD